MKKLKVPFDDRVAQRYLEQDNVSLDKLLEDLVETYEYDYGSICQMIGMFAVIAAKKANASDAGGITGFQANGVMWEFIQKWMHFDGAMKLVQYKNMLYPQYNDKFQKTISKDTFNWLQTEAQKKLDEYQNTKDSGRQVTVHEAVLEHWKALVNGMVPFGYTVREEM